MLTATQSSDLPLQELAQRSHTAVLQLDAPGAAQAAGRSRVTAFEPFSPQLRVSTAELI